MALQGFVAGLMPSSEWRSTELVTLILQKSEVAFLIPSGAVLRNKDGKTYIFQVNKDHVANRLQVQVQWEDGARVKVAVILEEGDPDLGVDDVLKELTGTEEIIANGQGEISHGHPVTPNLIK